MGVTSLIFIALVKSEKRLNRKRKTILLILAEWKVKA